MKNRERLQDEITPEYMIKYFKADADRANAKLKKLIPYTKSLEARVIQLEGTIEKLNKQISGLTKEVANSVPYKQLLERYCKIKHDNRTLLLEVAKK